MILLSHCGSSVSSITSNQSASDALTPSAYGTYIASNLKCNGFDPTSLLSNWTTSPTTMTVTLNRTLTGTQTWSNGSCSITRTFTFIITTPGAFETTDIGTYTCTGSSCATYSSNLFGSDLCNTSNTGNNNFTYTPTEGAIPGGTIIATGASLDTTCSDNGGDSDPISYTATKQ